MKIFDILGNKYITEGIEVEYTGTSGTYSIGRIVDNGKYILYSGGVRLNGRDIIQSGDILLYLDKVDDIVSWIESNVKLGNDYIKLYEHQKTILKCDSSKKLILHGRRIGATTTILLDMLYKATHECCNIVYYTPYTNSLYAVGQQFMDMCITSDTIDRMIANTNKHITKFSNGSVVGFIGDPIIGFGLKPYTYIDNTAYINPKILNKLLLRDKAVIATTIPNKYNNDNINEVYTIIRGVYDGSEYTKFKYPSTIMPEFNDTYIRDNISSEYYRREVLAEWDD